MTEPGTAASHVEFLRRLADRLDPNIPWNATASGVDDVATLRLIAEQLARVAGGGDRPAPEGLTAEPSTYQAEPPAD